MTAAYSICSPPASGNAALAIVEITGDVDATLTALGVVAVAPPRAVLRTVPGVDTLVIARPERDRALVFPHAGPVILRRLVAALERCGVAPTESLGRTGPVGFADFDRLADTLARAASPLAIDLLLDQPRRWADPAIKPVSPEVARQLNRLIDPPLVVALGPPNIGKSSLLNALAGRTVSIVADQPGTTRDHVGALIDFAGVVARFIDAPGIGPTHETDDDIQAESQRLALEAAAGADLVLVCADRGSGFTVAPPAGLPSLRVALRADLGVPEGAPFDMAVSVRQPLADEGLRQLVELIRERLVPAAALVDHGSWGFSDHQMSGSGE